MNAPDIEPTCEGCGSGLDHEECPTCGGDGYDGHDCGDDTCCCLDPEENMTCGTCEGHGGWWRCFSCHPEPRP